MLKSVRIKGKFKGIPANLPSNSAVIVRFKGEFKGIPTNALDIRL